MDSGRRRSACARRGVLLIDLAITIALIGIIVVAVIPTVRPEEHVKLIAASSILASDIEYAQSASLAAPGDPIVVRFDVAQARYWLALQSEPDSPIMRPNSDDAYEVVYGEGAADDLWGLSIALTNVIDATITFDAFGRATQADDPAITLANEAGDVRVRVRAGTGSVWIEKAD
jgi:hypothetical protein